MADRIVVDLTPAEVMQAAQVGVMRRVKNIREGFAKAPQWGPVKDDTWTGDIEGACGEFAVAKYLGWFWNGAIGDLSAADVRRLQVKTTIREDGRLIVKQKNPDQAKYVLVRGWAPRFWIVGWCYGYEAKQQAFWADPGNSGQPAFYVPNDRLRAMESLFEMEAA